MRVNRSLLYVGLFLLAIGVVAVASDGSLLDTGALTGVVQLWPLAVIAVGTGLVLKRTRFGLAGGMMAAALPGLVLGSVFAVAPRYAGHCGSTSEPAFATTDQGTFEGQVPPTIYLSTGCGSLDVQTAVGHAWRLEAGNSAGTRPVVHTSGQSLSIGAPGKEGWQVIGGGRDKWAFTLPATDIDALEIRANANQSRIDLTGTRIGLFEVMANAADVRVDATRSEIGDMSVRVNAGALSVSLPISDDVSGDFVVSAGNLQVCVPPEVGLSIETRGSARQLTVNGLPMNEHVPDWRSDNYESATYRADVYVKVNFGTVEINPIGGCR